MSQRAASSEAIAEVRARAAALQQQRCSSSVAAAVAAAVAAVFAMLLTCSTGLFEPLPKMGKGNQAPGPLRTPRARAAQIALHA